MVIRVIVKKVMLKLNIKSVVAAKSIEIKPSFLNFIAAYVTKLANRIEPITRSWIQN